MQLLKIYEYFLNVVSIRFHIYIIYTNDIYILVESDKYFLKFRGKKEAMHNKSIENKRD